MNALDTTALPEQKERRGKEIAEIENVILETVLAHAFINFRLHSPFSRERSPATARTDWLHDSVLHWKCSPCPTRNLAKGRRIAYCTVAVGRPLTFIPLTAPGRPASEAFLMSFDRQSRLRHLGLVD